MVDDVRITPARRRALAVIAHHRGQAVASHQTSMMMGTVYGQTADGLIRAGLVATDRSVLVLTAKGYRVANELGVAPKRAVS